MEDQARLSSHHRSASVLLAIAAPEAGIAALTATTAGNMQNQINYTRSNEKKPTALVSTRSQKQGSM